MCRDLGKFSAAKDKIAEMRQRLTKARLWRALHATQMDVDFTLGPQEGFRQGVAWSSAHFW